MHKFTKKQKLLLMEIGKNKGRQLSRLARDIYTSAASCYRAKDIMVSLNYVKIDIVQNYVQIPVLTSRGLKLNEIFKEELLNGSRFY